MEKEMYPIIKTYLEGLGFKVQAEVNDVDIMAMKEDLVYLIEMKTDLSHTLIAQGLKRKSIGDIVYLAIPHPTKKVLRSSLFKDKCFILKNLELGLLLVDIHQGILEVYLDPTSYKQKVKSKQKKKLLKEFGQRKMNYNVGGVTKTKILTSYRELALLTLYFLKEEAKSTKEIKGFVGNDKVLSLLQKNYYGWFVRKSRGVYETSHLGIQALSKYKTILDELITTHLAQKNNESS